MEQRTEIPVRGDGLGHLQQGLERPFQQFGARSPLG
jgi:hypothetical protein